MSPTRSKWAVASLTVLLLVGAAAASAVVRVESASGDVAVEAEAEGPNSSAAGNETNETNETPPPPPPPPTNNTTHVAPPILSPEHQNVSGPGSGNGTTFALVVKNPAKSRQNVTLAAAAPTLWTVTLSATNVSLAPGESYGFTGTIRVAHALGGTGTVYVTATGLGGEDSATVSACIKGLLQACPTTNGTSPPPNGTRPPRNETPPPGNGTNGPRPPTNQTPPGNGNNGTMPPTNGTPPSNDTSGASYPASQPMVAPPVDTAADVLGLPRATGGALRPELGGV